MVRITGIGRAAAAAGVLLAAASVSGRQSSPPPRYYAHALVTDSDGVIAPWYTGPNGQFDWRVRIAAETLKRYPWTDKPSRAPHWVFNGTWSVAPDGAITIPKLNDWDNGDLGQRAAYVLSGLVDYYRYSGDASAIGLISLQADALLDWEVTAPSHPWPGFIVSVPNKGVPYGRANPASMMQIDIAAETGIGMIRAYQLVGRKRWLDAARRWALTMADKRDRRPGPGVSPWARYANPDSAPWEDLQTGGVVFILEFFEEMLKLGIAPNERSRIRAARDAGERYFRETLLPRWTVNDTWGRNYWDWPDPVQAENVTEFACRYMMDHRDRFPNWRSDVRNVLTLFLNRTSVAPESGGDVFHGAWAYPESSGCCGRSLWYGPLELAMVYLQYAELANSEWAREMGRRQVILATYDAHETGVVEDNIDGGPIVAGAWFKIAHPMALKHVLGAIAWLPDYLGANRENHIVRSTSVVRNVRYASGSVSYQTFDAHAPAVDVLRLAYVPASVLSAGRALPRRGDSLSPGWTCAKLPNGDAVVTVRHDGATNVEVKGIDPARTSRASDWRWSFRGSQVRVMGSVRPDGGLAEVTLDGAVQRVRIDAWSPVARSDQVLWYRNGLTDGEHSVSVRPLRQGNPVSRGTVVVIDSLQWSDARGRSPDGRGGGPAGAQRVILGYAGRNPYTDRSGQKWLPATELVTRTGAMTDSVQQTWWTEPRRATIAGTPDPTLYRFGVHAKEFTHHFTAAPGRYHVRLKFAETRQAPPSERAVDVWINGTPVAKDLDLAATAGGMYRAADLVYDSIRPRHGVISIRVAGSRGGEAILQAMQIGPGAGGRGAKPVSLSALPGPADGSLLTNGGFEGTQAGVLGSLGDKKELAGWTCLFLGPSRGYVWAEGDYAIHPDWGLPVIRSGKQALRTHADTTGRSMVYQETAVRAKTAYEASVWANPCDLRGAGFGRSADDVAVLRVQEIAADGHIVATHAAEAVRTPGARRVAVVFTSSAETVRVRFVLDTTVGCPYNEGHVTYDDAALKPI